ncbi:MAG: hypothetical protein IPI08_10585 [Betaproteobacteria bacterium]|nr:hypothetical protein [Betaproteobacteria bacterium]
MELLPTTQQAIYGDVGRTSIVAAMESHRDADGRARREAVDVTAPRKRVRWFTPGQVLRMATGSTGELLSARPPLGGPGRRHRAGCAGRPAAGRR